MDSRREEFQRLRRCVEMLRDLATIGLEGAGEAPASEAAVEALGLRVHIVLREPSFPVTLRNVTSFRLTSNGDWGFGSYVHSKAVHYTLESVKVIDAICETERADAFIEGEPCPA